MPTRIFISYARNDAKPLAMRLRDDLQAVGHAVWLDLSEIPGGSSWSKNIEDAIEECNVVVALMSPAAYESQWCRAEQLRAVRKGKRIIPLLVVPGAEIPLHLEHLNYLDFTVPERYDSMLQDLLSDVTAGLAFQNVAVAPASPKKSLLFRRRTTRKTSPGKKRGASTFRRQLAGLRGASWLGARFWWPYFLFHFTDIQALIQILQAGELVAPYYRGENFTGRWDRYVKLYFRPRTPDLFHAEGFRPGGSPAPIPVYLLFDMEAMLNHPEARFASGDPAKTKTTYKTPSFFGEMPFEQIYHDSWFMPDEKDDIMRHREAQVIIPERLSLEGLQILWMRSPAEYETLHHLMPAELWRKWRDKITARTDYHLFNHKRAYVQSASLGEKTLHFRFNLPPSARETSIFAAEIEAIYPDGRRYVWRDDTWHVQAMLTLALPGGEGYTVTLRLDGDIAYSGKHTASLMVV